MKMTTIRITGISPLLQHNPASMAKTSGDGEALKGGKKKYVPSEEAEASVYRNADGHIVHPSIAFRAAIFRACVNRKIGKASAKTVISASVFPVEQFCLLVDPKSGKPLKNYEIHSARVVVQRAGIIRCRPMISPWATDLVLEIDEEMLPNQDILVQLLQIAGKVAGVGDWRPEKLGTFGRFTAELKA